MTKLGGLCSTERGILAAILRGPQAVCLEASLGTWGPDPILSQPFAITEQEIISDRKKMTRNWVRLPRPKQDLKTLTTSHGPQTWQRGLSA